MGEGGPELVKQLLSQTFDINMPQVVAVYLKGSPRPGVGPQDVALAIIGEVFANGYVKNKVMEFVGPGVANLSADFRIGIDVMTTETTCLSSIWQTDSRIEEFYAIHGRSEDYKELKPGQIAYYDGMIEIDLDEIKPMIAMPFHPSNTYTIDELKANLMDILDDVEKKAQVSLDGKIDFSLKNKVVDGKLYVDQGIIAGCAGGGFENICAAADILKGSSIGCDTFTLSVYPASTPIYMELAKNGTLAALLETGSGGENRVLRSVLRRRRHSREQCVQHSSYDQELPEPRRLQDSERTDFFRGAYGRPFHRGYRREQRLPDFRGGVHGRIYKSEVLFR